MNKPHRLNTVLELARKDEQTHAAELARINRQFAEQHQRLQQLRGYRGDYSRRLNEKGGKPISVALIGGHARFIEKLSGTIREQEAVVDDLGARRNAIQSRWQAACTRVRSLENAIEKDHRAEAARREMRQEREVDEWTQSKARMRADGAD